MSMSGMHRFASTLFLVGFLSSCAPAGNGGITNFEECAAAGNPVMESYPRRCRAGDRTFTEEIDEPVNPALP